MLQYNIEELFMENSMEEWKSKASLLMITIAVMLANISMGSTILPNIVPGIGMISVVIPITTIIYSYVSKPETKTIIFASELIAKTFNEAVKNFFKEMNLEINKEEFIILESIYLKPGIIQFDIAKNIVMKRSYVCKFLGELGR